MFSKYIINWYNSNGRDLPWRNTRDPYKIWISEVILQQTRVDQGYDYYNRFINRFPTVSDLANAEEFEVLKYWQGLGYYSRARNLHAAAKSIVGEFPKDYKEVIALKGVGEYTAAAICSFAYGMPYAVVDGNVYRVLSRYFGVDTPIDTTKGKKEFAELAQELIDKNEPAIYNQAIMDFGALQCTPKQPLCLYCPLIDSCVAYNEGKIDKLPFKQGKVKVRDRFFNYFVFIADDGYTLLNKREHNDIWKNMYDFPLIETPNQTDLSILLGQELFENLRVEDVKTVIQDCKHILSHQRLHTNIYKIAVKDIDNISGQFLKIKLEDLNLYPMPKLVYQFIPKLLE